MFERNTTGLVCRGRVFQGYLQLVPVLAMLCVWQMPHLLAAQELQLQDLTEQEYSAMERINLDRVTGTISFLASDELGGRGTPSPELTIAEAYVASRFRSAGLEGLGPDGSFFLESQLDTVRVPSSGWKLTLGSKAIDGVELLMAAEGELSYTGAVPAASEVSDGKDLDAPVFLDEGFSLEGQRSPAFALMRLAQQWQQRGATALLIAADEDSPLREMAKQAQAQAQSRRRGTGNTIPVVLVNAEMWNASAECSISIPGILHEPATVRNVIGVVRGSDPELSKEAMIFSAHLDHLGSGGTGEDKIYNGADDDASGVTAVLTLADAYAALKEKPKRSAIFLTFWGEERGLLGSREFVEVSPWSLDDVVANINIEMIGRPEEGARNKMWMTGWTKSNLGDIVNAGSRRIGVETFEHPRFSAQLYRASDNWAFVQKGVIAHSFSGGSLHEDYHQVTDEWSKLDLPHMTQVIRGLFAGTLPIANGEVKPAEK